MKALFIGRFQPFHKGHLKVIQDISKKYDEIIIGIGSSQYANTMENPFTAAEREEMIKKSLKEIGVKNYKIFFIPDIHNPSKWVDHVTSIIPSFDVVVSNNTFTLTLFSEKGFKVIKTPLYNKKMYSGKEIRKRMINDEKWVDLVPTPVANIIKDIDGVKRLKNFIKKREKKVFKMFFLSVSLFY